MCNKESDMNWDKIYQIENKSQVQFVGRPERDTIISEDEILDLIILLHTETDFDTFLSKI